jgi:hypothetical protein
MPMNELEETAAKQELAAMMDGGRYKLLEIAVVVLKVLAVIYFLSSFYGLFLAPAVEGSSRSVSEKIGPMATLMALVRDVLVAFLVFVSGEIVRLLLDLRRLAERARG